MNAAFQYAIYRTLDHEGGYVHDSSDPGGETNFGISRRSYPDLDIEHLTRDQAAEIYYRDFFVKPGIDNLADPILCAKVFDLAVNCGPGTAIKFLQQAINALGAGPVSEDGALGPKTLAAVNKYRNSQALLSTVKLFAGRHYIDLGKPRFLAGWVNRLMTD